MIIYLRENSYKSFLFGCKEYSRIRIIIKLVLIIIKNTIESKRYHNLANTSTSWFKYGLNFSEFI